MLLKYLQKDNLIQFFSYKLLHCTFLTLLLLTFQLVMHDSRLWP
jgi:hypothetical protein